MEDIRSIHLRRLHGELGEILYQLTKVQFTPLGAPDTWKPSVNAYRCRDALAVCVDLAGVDKERIDLQVEPRRLLIRGFREAPEPEAAEQKPVQVLVMEIDYGPFEREVLFPIAVEPDRVTATQRNGLLWVYLPLRPHG